MSTKVKGDKIKEGSIPLSALSDEVKGNFYGKYGLNGYLGELVDNNPLFIEGNRYIIYMSTKDKIYRFGQGVYSVTVSGYGPPVTITGSQTSKGWNFTASGDTVARYELKFYADKVDVEIPTPDWNAQEGEAGYIDNKPCGIYNKDDCFFGDNFWVISGKNLALYVKQNEYNGVTLDHKINSIYGFGYNNEKVEFLVNGGAIISVHYNNGLPYVVDDEGAFEDQETLNEFCNACLGTCNINEIKKIYLPDTVVKTTPQTLSNTDKNQALANLGIDPVVWKYMCEPFKLENGVKIPQELHNIIWDNKLSKLKPISSKLLITDTRIIDYIGSDFVEVSSIGLRYEYNAADNIFVEFV